jgi:hypothetical protein
MASNSKPPVQEIDLLELNRKIGKGIRNLFVGLYKVILFLIIFGLKRIHFLLIFVLAGALVGYVLFKNTRRYYSSSMIAQANGINSSDMITYINDLHTLCQKNNTDALALDLQMPDTTARKIKDIQAFFIIDVNKDEVGDYVDFKNSFNPKDTTQQQLIDRFYVSVEVYDNTIFRNVRDGLFRYMRKNPYIIKLNEIRKNELQELIRQSEIEVEKLDSLQNTDYFQNLKKVPIDKDQLTFMAVKETPMYYKDKLSLLYRKQMFQKELELATDAFTIIKDFTSLAIAENPKGKYIINYGILFGLFGYFLLLIIKYRRIFISQIKTDI